MEYTKNQNEAPYKPSRAAEQDRRGAELTRSIKRANESSVGHRRAESGPVAPLGRVKPMVKKLSH